MKMDVNARMMIWLVAFGCLALAIILAVRIWPSKSNRWEDLKVVTSAGKQVSFQVPSQWKEDYKEGHGGTFYLDSPESGTLRVNVMTANAPTNGAAKSALEAFLVSRSERQAVVQTADGNYVERKESYATDQGIPIFMVTWTVCKVLSQDAARIAVFTYTCATENREKTICAEEIRNLNELIPKVRFSNT